MTPRLLVRNGAQSKLLQQEKCELVFGDVDDKTAVMETLNGCSAVIYNIGIIREFPANGITYESLHYLGAKQCIDAAVNFKIDRFILMSANGVKADGTGYQKTKMLAEEYLKSVNLDYTIFRPSLVFGDPRGNGRPEFCSQLKKDMLSLPFPSPNFFPGLNPFNSGNFSMSPIHAKDVASVFVKSINEIKTLKKPIIWEERQFTGKILLRSFQEHTGKTNGPFLHQLFSSNRWLPYSDDLHGFPLQKIKLQCLWKETSAILKKFSAHLKSNRFLLILNLFLT